MKMNVMKKLNLYALVLGILAFSSCHTNKGKEDESHVKAYPRVRATTVTFGPISSQVDVNATASYLKASVISSPFDGYIVRSFVEPRQNVGPGQILYILQTRESHALGAVNPELPGHFGGTDTIRAHSEGYVTETVHQQGDYVTGGEKLLTMKETSSLVFVLHLPYEWHNLVNPGMKVELRFPDGTRHTGKVKLISPEVDSADQTLKVILSVTNARAVPEGLIARAEITRKSSENATLLPSDAVLTNETETDYWVMKMINDSVAVKVPVTTGIASHDTMQILSPSFTKKDRILIYGNYAVPDTMQVILTDTAQ